MRKNKPYREYVANLSNASRSIFVTLQFIQSVNHLLDISVFNLIGTGTDPSGLYKISSKLISLNSELRAIQRQIESKIEVAEKKAWIEKNKATRRAILTGRE